MANELQFGMNYVIYNVAVNTANYQFKKILPTGTKQFSIQNLTATPFKLLTASGSATTFKILKNTRYDSPAALNLDEIYLYFKATAVSTIQIIAYY